MDSDAYIWTGNHLSKDGIEDIIETIRSAFAGSLDIKINNCLIPGKINFIIDEFSKPESISTIQRILNQNPDTFILLVATEFLTCGPRHRPTFNYFERGPKQKLKAAIVALIGILESKAHRAGKENHTRDILNQNNRTRKILRSILRRIRYQRYRNLGNLRYLQKRCDGFLQALDHANLILVLHDEIAESLRKYAPEKIKTIPNIYRLLPIIDAITFSEKFTKLNRNFVFEITGSITKYRYWVASIFDQIIDANIYADPVVVRGFGEKDKHGSEIKSAFSIHVPQTMDWKFSSPMRIYRSFRQGKIPVIINRLYDHPIEDACLFLEVSEDNFIELSHQWHYEFISICDQLTNKIKDYNRIAERENKNLISYVYKAHR